MKLRTSVFALTSLFASLASSSAHQVWIEDTPEGRLVVRFAEFGGEYEKSPGALDSLTLPAAFLASDDGKGKFVVTERKSDHFLVGDLPAKAGAQIETAFSVRGGGDKPAIKPIFYARWQPADAKAGAPALTFDLVPTGTLGEARITFRGEAVADAKVTAFLPDGTEQELTADKAGLVRVNQDKPGLYLLVGKHQRESQKGFWAGKVYDTVSHNCSLAWRVQAKR